MYLVISATEHTEVSMEEQKKSIKERLEEKKQEVKNKKNNRKLKKPEAWNYKKADVGVDKNRKFLRKN